MAAEQAAARAEQVASAAMKAAEVAVKEEMQAAAVVKETGQALGKALTQLHNLDTGEDAPPPDPTASVAGAAGDTQASVAATVVSAQHLRSSQADHAYMRGHED